MVLIIPADRHRGTQGMPFFILAVWQRNLAGTLIPRCLRHRPAAAVPGRHNAVVVGHRFSAPLFLIARDWLSHS
jgi:hypothetical protein